MYVWYVKSKINAPIDIHSCSMNPFSNESFFNKADSSVTQENPQQGYCKYQLAIVGPGERGSVGRETGDSGRGTGEKSVLHQ